MQPKVPIGDRLGVKTLKAMLMNFESDNIPNYDETIKSLQSHGYCRNQLKLELDLKNHETPPIKPSIEERPVFEIKTLLVYLRYMFLGLKKTLPKIIRENLDDRQVESLVSILKRFKRETAWRIADMNLLRHLYS